MATQYIEDPETKERIPFEWGQETPPTSEDIDSLFQSVRKSKSPVAPVPKTAGELIKQGIYNIPKSGWNVIKGAAGAVTSPFETAGNIGAFVGKVGRAGLEQLMGEEVDPEAEAAVKAYAEPVRKAITHPAGIPRQIGEFVSEYPVESGLMASGGLMGAGGALSRIGVLPRVATAVTKAGEYINPFYLPGAAAGKVVSKIAGKTSPMEEIISKGIEKGVKPSIAGKGTFARAKAYETKATDAVRSIVANKDNLLFTDVAGGVAKGQLPTNLKQFSQAVEQTKQTIFDKYNALTSEAGQQGAVVDLSPIVKELRVVTSKAPAADFNAPVVNYATKLSDTLTERGAYSVKDAQDAVAMLNDRLDAFYKNPSYESASVAYVDAMVANRLRQLLDKTVEGFTGERYQPLKNQYGSLRAIEKDVTNRATIDARKAVKGILDFSDVFTGYHIVRGLITLNPSTIVAGGFAKYLSWLYKIKNDPNVIIKKMFTSAEKAIAKEPPFTPYAGPPGTMIPRFPESKYMVGQPTPTEPLRYPPTVFVPREAGGLPVPTGERFGVESIRHPQLEWWRGAGAKGVQPIPGPERTALPAGIGFTAREPGFVPTERFTPPARTYPPAEIGPGITPQTVQRRAPSPILPKGYYAPMYDKEVALARGAIASGADIRRVREMFKSRTRQEYPE